MLPNAESALLPNEQEPARVVERSYPGLEVSRNLSFSELWQFFKETGFLYPEKLARLEPFMAEIERTVATLLRASGNLLETVVLRRDGQLTGHLCSLRSYERTWSVQHLAARRIASRHFDTSARLNLAMAYYGELRRDIDWHKMFFRPNNLWPARVFGGFARQIDDPATSDLRTFQYLTAPTAGAAAYPPGIRVRRVAAAESPFVEQWFLARGRIAEVRANDLSAAEDPCRIERRFAEHGLRRGREILVAERDGKPAGFALLEVSSLGMNFSELTNAFTVHPLNDDPETRFALIVGARERYRELGRPQCIALEDGGDLSAFEANGFAVSKAYTCWTFHRNHTPAVEEYFVRLFSDRRREN